MNEYSVCVMIGFNIKAKNYKEAEEKIKNMIFDDVNIHNIEIERIKNGRRGGGNVSIWCKEDEEEFL